jgi:hypothetical protein
VVITDDASTQQKNSLTLRLLAPNRPKAPNIDGGSIAVKIAGDA